MTEQEKWTKIAQGHRDPATRDNYARALKEKYGIAVDVQPSPKFVPGLPSDPSSPKFTPQQRARYDEVLKQQTEGSIRQPGVAQSNEEQQDWDQIGKLSRFTSRSGMTPGDSERWRGVLSEEQQDFARQGGADAAIALATLPLGGPLFKGATAVAGRALPPALAKIVGGVGSNVLAQEATSVPLEALRASAKGKDVLAAAGDAAKYPADVLADPANNKLAALLLYGLPIAGPLMEGVGNIAQNLKAKWRAPNTTSGKFIGQYEEGAMLPETRAVVQEVAPGPERVTEGAQRGMSQVFDQMSQVDDLSSKMYAQAAEPLEASVAANTPVPYGTGHRIMDSAVARKPSGEPMDPRLASLVDDIKQNFMSKDPRTLLPRREPVIGDTDMPTVPNPDSPGNPATWEASQRAQGRGFLGPNGLDLIPDQLPPVPEPQFSRFQRQIPRDPTAPRISSIDNPPHVPDSEYPQGQIPVEMSIGQAPPESYPSSGMAPGEHIGASGSEVWSKAFVSPDQWPIDPTSLAAQSPSRLGPGGAVPINKLEAGNVPSVFRRRARKPGEYVPDVGTPEQMIEGKEPIASLSELQGAKKYANQAVFEGGSEGIMAHPGRKQASGAAITSRNDFFEAVPPQDREEVSQIIRRLRVADAAFKRARGSNETVVKDFLSDVDPERFFDPATGQFDLIKFREKAAQVVKQMGADTEAGATRMARAKDIASRKGNLTPFKLTPASSSDPETAALLSRGKYAGAEEQVSGMNDTLRSLNDAENRLIDTSSNVAKTEMALNAMESTRPDLPIIGGESRRAANIDNALRLNRMPIGSPSTMNWFKLRFAGTRMPDPQSTEMLGGWADMLTEGLNRSSDAVSRYNPFASLQEYQNQQRDKRAQALIHRR